MYSFEGVKRVLPPLLAALTAATAAGATRPVSIVLDKPTATPHAIVVAKTAGKGALRAVRKRVLRLSLGDVPLGRLSVNRNGNGRLRFEVPNVPAGDYSLLLRGLPRRPTSLRVASLKVVEGNPAVRGCQRSVFGGLDEAYVARSVGFGPVKLVGYDPAKAADPAWPRKNPRTGEYGVKVLLLLTRGKQVTLGVAAQDRRLVALTYMPERLNRYRVAGEDAAVTFIACRGDESVQWAGEPWTQFNGGFVFLRPLCAHFELHVDGEPDPVRFALPFGRSC